MNDENLGEYADDKEIATRDYYGKRRLQRSPGRVNIDITKITSEISDRHQRATDQKRACFDAGQRQTLS